MPRSRGRTGRPWRSASAAVRARAAAGEPCCRCGGQIDVTLPPRTRWSFSVDHLVPLSRGGDPLAPGNLAPCHHGCNARGGAGLTNSARRRRRSAAKARAGGELPRYSTARPSSQELPQW